MPRKHAQPRKRVLVAFRFRADSVCMQTLEKQVGVVTKRPAGERGRTQIGWLDSWHTFSFGEYYHPNHMEFHSLRVINDDIVEPGQGFGMHPHRNAEIFTYVIEGQLQHRDSMGNGSIIKAGDLQYMSAGSGVYHSEFNPSEKERVHLLQIWLKPNTQGGEPRYSEKALGDKAERNALTLLFSGNKKAGAAQIRQDAQIFFGKVDAGNSVSTALTEGRHAWIHLIRGEVELLGERLQPGDGAAISEAPTLQITGTKDAEFLLFDLP